MLQTITVCFSSARNLKREGYLLQWKAENPAGDIRIGEDTAELLECGEGKIYEQF